MTQLNIGSTNSDKLAVNEAIYAQATRELNLPPLTYLPRHKYCFTTGQSGDAFYLKLGASCKFFEFFPIFLKQDLMIIIALIFQFTQGLHSVWSSIQRFNAATMRILYLQMVTVSSNALRT